MIWTCSITPLVKLWDPPNKAFFLGFIPCWTGWRCSGITFYSSGSTEIGSNGSNTIKPSLRLIFLDNTLCNFCLCVFTFCLYYNFCGIVLFSALWSMSAENTYRNSFGRNINSLFNQFGTVIIHLQSLLAMLSAFLLTTFQIFLNINFLNFFQLSQ